MTKPTRIRILDGAGRAFARLGYGACSVEDILDESGVSRPTFYKFFSDKAEVFRAVEEAFTLSFVHAIEGASDATLEPRERAESLLDAYLYWISGQRSIARMMFTDSTHPAAGHLMETRNSTFEIFIDIMREILATDDGPEADEFVYRGLIGAISEVGMALVEQPRLRDADVRRARASIERIVTATVADWPQAEVPPLPLKADGEYRCDSSHS